jgi:hypothetical protein
VSHNLDPCSSYSETQSDVKLNKLSALLEDHIIENDPDNIATFKGLLGREGLLDLLPGSVMGFALRDRKWRK